jgi:hypothetical protein
VAPKEPGDGHRRFGSRMTRKQSKLAAAIFADRLEELLAQARARDAATQPSPAPKRGRRR